MPPPIEKTRDHRKKAGKIYNNKICPVAGHAYMRGGDDPEGSAENKKARDESWKRVEEILEEKE